MKKASDLYRRYVNPCGKAVSTVSRNVLMQDGLYFKDIDGSGTVSKVNDWRVSPEERAKAYVKQLSVKEKIAQLFISDWRMAKYPGMPPMAPQIDDPVSDETGILEESNVDRETIFGHQHLPATTVLLKEWFNRHLILRVNPRPADMADWVNQMMRVCEECAHFIPVEIASNSRNEHGEVVFGMNDASGVFAVWPGTLGIAAAVKGSGDYGIIDRFADCIRREWTACGMRKGYMYMADCVTDPRWQRTFGTFGEDTELIRNVFERLIPGIQGSGEGVTDNGVAMTVKHFPGGGARENGFDPHYAAGQWNVYPTDGSLEKYHIPCFEPACRLKAASVMPYYSKPSCAKSGKQKELETDYEAFGFAFNRAFINGILRNDMGFGGYVNSDTGILHNMAWGVEALDVPERIGLAVTHSGVDLISGLFDNEAGMEAYARSQNGYYSKHDVPLGLSKDEVVLTDESLDRAVTRTLTEMFRLGIFDDSFVDPKGAENAVNTVSDWEEAEKVHRASVVLLKNDGTLPLTCDKTNGKKIFARCFSKDAAKAEKETAELKKLLSEYELTDNCDAADYALLFVNPSSGAYFNATSGYLELDICEGKDVCDVGQDGKPLNTTHKETTLAGIAELLKIADTVHAHGGKVISNINFKLAWEVGNVESISDALTAGFDTFTRSVLDVITGKSVPAGRLPITLPKGDEVLRVDADGKCISPNDVPGYAKDAYMPETLKDENGKAYAYRDKAGNYYELGFGLTW